VTTSPEFIEAESSSPIKSSHISPRGVTFALIIVGVLQGVGIYLSELLIRAHIELKLGDEQDSGLCAASDFFSCKAAAGSSYSELFGVPIAVLGEAYYACILFVILYCGFMKPDWRRNGLILIGITAMLSVIYSLFLGGVSYWSLGTLCPLCIGLYLVNILTLVIVAWSNSWFTPLVHPLTGVMVILMGLSLVGTQSIYALRHQHAHKRLKEHRQMMKKRSKARTPVQIPVTVNGAPVRGSGTGSMIIEFSDFQCPFCRRFTGYMKKAFEDPEGQPFSYAFRHFPLSSECNPYVKKNMHPRACHAAIAAICAQEQGSFWEMHDLLFAHQHELEDEDLRRYAVKIGLDADLFKTCTQGESARKRLDLDISEAKRFGVPATPVFFVNGWRHFGAKRPKKIREALTKYPYQSSDAGQDVQPSSSKRPSPEAPSPARTQASDTLPKEPSKSSSSSVQGQPSAPEVKP
jgi:protein-disulfide isomerase/uncharacterized membrane protein